MRDSNRPGALSRTQLAAMTDAQFEAWLRKHGLSGMAAVAASQKRKAAQRAAARADLPPVCYGEDR